MAEKGFGVKEINFCGSTPKITSLTNLNLNAVNVAISTNATIGGTLSVTGNVSVGGVLTYEDVTNIDSVGLITARSGIDCNGDIDVDGHTNLDNVNIAGVTTFSDTSEVYIAGGKIVKSGVSVSIAGTHVSLVNAANTQFLLQAVQGSWTKLFFNGSEKLVTSNTGISVTGSVVSTGADINGDIDVDGHTDLDNVNVAGVSTFAGDVIINSGSELLVNTTTSFESATGFGNLVVGAGSGSEGIVIYSGNGVGYEGVLGFADGTSGAAAWGAGIRFRHDINRFRFQIGGSERLALDSSGNLNVTGVCTATSFVGDGSSLTGIAVTEAPVVDYTITANGSSAYRFHGGGVDETADDPDLYLIRGQKYRFNNTTGSSHPFEFRDGTGADSSTYSNGVTGDDEGVQFFTVPYDAPAKIFYRCTIHSGMVGNIYIRGANGQNDNVGITTFSGDINLSSGQMSVTTPEYLRVAHTNASHNQSLSDNQTYIIQFGSEYNDTKNGWTTGSSNYYTIQKSGYFLVTTQAVITSNTANELREYSIGIERSTDNGSSWSLLMNNGARGGGNDSTDTDTDCPNVTHVFNYTAGDRIRIRAHANTGSGNWQIDEDLDDTGGNYGGNSFDNQKGTQLMIIRLF